MKYRYLLAIGFSLALVVACTDNRSAYKHGGTMTIHLKSNRKFVNATWKNDNLWFVTRPMREGEKAESWSFKEKSNYGINEGEVIFEERKE